MTTVQGRRGRGIISDVVGKVGDLAGTVLNKSIDLLPVELHLPGGYRYCGPGTKLKERLARGDPGINKLDEACKTHDIAYSKYSDNTNRRMADRRLADSAWARVKASDASLGEKAAAWAVTTAMNAKATLGAGKRKKQNMQKGDGLYLRPWKGGGLYLRPWKGGILLEPVQIKKKQGGVSKKKSFSIKQIPIKALSNFDVLYYANMLKIPYFRGVFVRNALPLKPRHNESAVVNLDSSAGRGTHWVCYEKRGNIVHYFDSFGNLRPPLELEEYFKGCKVFYNYDRRQSYDTVVCGHLCLQFLMDRVQ